MEYDAGISMSQPYDEDTLWQMNLRSSETMELGPYPVREGEPDCSYYIRTGLCRFGATCRFNHPPNRKLDSIQFQAIATARMKGEYPERIGQPECQYYLKTGTCKFGATCKFHHPRDKAGIAGRVPVNVLGYPLRPNETECAYYLRTGQCKFGSTCKFHHPPPSNMMVSLRGSPVYPSAHSPTTADQQSYPGGIANWPLSRASFIPSPRWQGPSSYGPMILPQGVVSVPGWNAYSVLPRAIKLTERFCFQGQLSSMSSPESQQQTAGNSIYGNSRQSEAANAGSQGTLSPYRSGSVPVGYYALQRENVFPERPGQPECQFYMKTGDCKFGAVCRFHHPRERLIPAPDCVLSPIGLPLRPGEPLCIFYSRYGICKFGPSCKFDHPMGVLTYNLAASSSSADAPVVRRLLASSSGSGVLALSSEGLVEAGSSKPRRLSLSESRSMPSGSYCRTPFWPTETLIWKAAESSITDSSSHWVNFFQHLKAVLYVFLQRFDDYGFLVKLVAEPLFAGTSGRSLGPGGEVHKTSMSPPQSKFAITARLIPKGAQTRNKKFLTSALRLIQGVLPQSDGLKELLSEIWTILALIADDHDDEQTKSIIPLPPLISSPSKITRMRHFLESGFDAKKMLEKLWNRQLANLSPPTGKPMGWKDQGGHVEAWKAEVERGEGVEGSGDNFGAVVEVGGRPRDRGIRVDGPFSKQYKEYNAGPQRSDEFNPNELGPVGYMNGAHILEKGTRAEIRPLGAKFRPDLFDNEGRSLGEREDEIQLGLADRVDDSVEREQRLAAKADEWVDERIEEENDAELLSRKVDEGCFEPTEVLQALNIYGSGFDESLEYDSGSGCEGDDQEESDLELINLLTEKGTVKEDESEGVSETMDHVGDSVNHGSTEPSSQRGHIVIPNSFSLGDGRGVSQCLGLKCSVRGMVDKGVIPDISGAMRDVSTINPVSYNANINVGQVNDAQEGASVKHLHSRGCVFISLRDSEAGTERWLMELSKYASCPIEENEIPYFKHLLQVMGLSLVSLNGRSDVSGLDNSVTRGESDEEGFRLERGPGS
ncbi:hypothetical protein TEA_022699 [Camellia sinensis var. sinensis]|uniref:C3H1-type domain-containing protein n=1 Tax=Camellia sinensis var. sinensis TaxID=542762 RepID=A0A4V3WQG6_CAMSN|nr:hypothetical protein TEA_022699 [Camellia sinensis var. sinensis]